MRRAVHRLAHRLGDLRELVHQVRLRVEAAGGVDEHDVGADLLRLLDRVEDRPRPGSRRPCRSRPRTPTRLPQTSSCCTAAARKVSPAASTTFLPSALQLRRELADRRRLADAVHADDHHDRGLGAESAMPPPPMREDLRRARRGARPTRAPLSRELVLRERSLDARREELGRLHADVGREQHLFDLLDDLRVDLLLAGEERAEPAEEALALARLGETLAQALDVALARGGRGGASRRRGRRGRGARRDYGRPASTSTRDLGAPLGFAGLAAVAAGRSRLLRAACGSASPGRAAGLLRPSCRPRVLRGRRFEGRLRRLPEEEQINGRRRTRTMPMTM